VRTNRLLLSTLSFLFLSQFASAQPAAENPPKAASPAALSSAKKIMSGVENADPSSSATKQIEATVHKYLMKNPQVVVEALQTYQQKQMESMQELFKDTQKNAPKYAEVLFHHDMDPVGGNAKGKITIVEFSDYQCSHCIETATVVDAVIKADPNIRVVVKEFPIRGAVSDAAARAALASNKQGKYWEFRDILFKNGNALTQDKIFELAQSIGLDVEKLKKDMDDAGIRKEVEANTKLAQSLKLVGTPAFFIAKSDVKPDASSAAITYIPGVITQEQLQTIIDKINHPVSDKATNSAKK
jgi:protein-disulfide isomerase